MNSYIKYVNNVINVIKESDKKNIILTGHNMAGKSDIIKKLVENNIETYYLIDTANKKIVIPENIPNFSFNDDIGTSVKITSRRVYQDIFNKYDVFSSGAREGEVISYLLFKDLYKNDSTFRGLMQKYIQMLNLKIDISIEDENIFVLKDILYDSDNVYLSSGYQALIRLFLELYLSYNIFNVKKVVIDEIDQHIDNSISYVIYNVIYELFPEITLISSLHSLTILENIQNAELIILDGKTHQFEILDSSVICGLDFISDRIFKTYENYSNISILNQIYSKLDSNKILTQEEYEYINKFESKKDEEDETRIYNEILNHTNYISIEKLFKKIFDGIQLSVSEKKYLKSFTPKNQTEHHYLEAIRSVLV